MSPLLHSCLWFQMSFPFICKVGRLLGASFSFSAAWWGGIFQHSFIYKFVTSPPSILSYLIPSPQHPLESAAVLLPYQETHAPSIQPPAAILNFFQGNCWEWEVLRDRRESLIMTPSLVGGCRLLFVRRPPEHRRYILDPLVCLENTADASQAALFEREWMCFVALWK